MNNVIANVLDDAADYIEKWGWIQDALEDGDGRVCIAGSINRALQQQAGGRAHLGVQWMGVRLDAIQAVLQVNDIGLIWEEVEDWNDEPYRTKQDVLDVLRKAAKQERK